MPIVLDPETYLAQPYEVSLETLALCNAACVFCPYPTLDRKRVKMDGGLIARVINQMSAWTLPFYFSPFKVNEPFLDRRIIDICDLVSTETRATLRLFSNGSPLTGKLCSDINALPRVEHLWISLNSHVKADYERIMGLVWENTVFKLDMLHGLVKDGDFRHRVVLSKVTQVGYSWEEEFRAYCGERWPLFEVFIIKQDGWLGYVPPADPTIPDQPCSRWWELSILSTGKVSLCCMDGKGEFSIGDINENTLLDIYNDPKYRTRRELMLSRRSIHPCRTCTY